MTEDSAGPAQVTPDGHVPVEYRLLGMDRRMVAPTLAVLAVVMLWAVVTPWIAGAMSYDVEVQPGTTIDVGDITFTPTPGWETVSQSESGVELHNAAVTLEITQGTFSGDDLIVLLAAVNEIEDVTAFVGPQNSITTDSGLVGLTESFENNSRHGMIVVFAQDGVGIEVVVEGPSPNVTILGSEIDAMISSIRITEVAS